MKVKSDLKSLRGKNVAAATIVSSDGGRLTSFS